MLNSKHKLVLIAAVDLEGGFAKDGKIPWHYKEDFKWFKNRTKGSVCVMGRKTYEDINERITEKRQSVEVNTGSLDITTTSTLLPDRECFVVSSSLTTLTNAKVISRWWDVDKHLTIDDQRTIFIIGGEELFHQSIPIADQVVLTIVNQTFECDRFFPMQYLVDRFTDIQTFKVDTAPELRFVVWQRIPGK